MGKPAKTPKGAIDRRKPLGQADHILLRRGEAIAGGREDRRRVRGSDRFDADGRAAGAAFHHPHVQGGVHAPRLWPGRRTPGAGPAGDEPGPVRPVPRRRRQHSTVVGARDPTAQRIARRFMDEIEGDPEHWRQRIVQNAIGVETQAGESLIGPSESSPPLGGPGRMEIRGPGRDSYLPQPLDHQTTLP